MQPAIIGIDLGKNSCSLVGLDAAGKARKNDDRDAEAIAEAASRPAMRFVGLKSEEHSTCRRCIACAANWSATGCR